MNIALACFKYSSSKTFPQDLVRLAQELHRRGHTVTLYCRLIADGSTLPPFIRLRTLAVKARSNAGRGSQFIHALRDALKQEPCDVLVAFNRIPGADFYYATTPCIAGAPLGGFSFWKRLMPRYRFNLKLEKRLFRPKVKTGILHISEQQKKEYQTFYGTPDRRFFHLPPDIPAGCGRPADAAERRKRMRRELDLREDDILLLTMGPFQAAGADRSIAALASLPLEYRQRCQLILAGNGNVSALRGFAKYCGVSGNVRFTIIDDELNDVLLASDLLLHPARSEEAGTAPLEALYAGVPVLGTSAGGWAREIVESESLLLPVPFQQKALNRLLRVLLSTPAKLEEMAREAIAVGGSLDLKRRFEFAADIITGSKSK